ncbi:hypothetical protein EDD37DRAFT_650929 [Exophiala viscosa]|uniref:Transcription factor domain-containing protein n=1 Tax=Exophiala viscosa TaxID=2486360 RepID=A0AAN6DR23_9EURO|nr:hypothetical protein EDD36DRAFT_420253 [Exophiala viscosa]KAI1623847.1 hypothetical protein EDD37DRAFT_650929 [Exophiala viscosa]
MPANSKEAICRHVVYQKSIFQRIEKLGRLLQHQQKTATAPLAPDFVTNMDCTARYPLSSEIDACVSRSMPTPESLRASSPEELCRGPLMPQFPDARELTELYDFFVENLLRWVPILRTEDIPSYEDMARNGECLLSNSMAYVAAGFVPGCRTVRARLAPAILSGLKQCVEESNEKSRWIAFQVIAVLYNWTMPTFHLTFSNREVSDWPLATDVLRAMWDRLASASTAQEASRDVARLLEHRSRDCDVRKHPRVREYLCRLWMYTIIHYRTWLANPLHVFKADPDIYTSKYIFRDYLTDQVIGPIIAQVELCLICERLSHVGSEFRSPQSCPTSNIADFSPHQPSTMLKKLADDLDTWYQEWSPGWTKRGSYEPLDAFYRFTRFCISGQATELCQSWSTSGIAPGTESSLIDPSIEAVVDLCSVLVELNPLSSYSLCFIPEDVFALALYGCEYVLGAQSKFRNLDTRHELSLRAMAELMIDVGPYGKEWTASQGYALLRRLDMRLSNHHGN